MTLINKISKFARSPQGRKAMQKAQTYASSPEGKRKIESLRARVGGGGSKKPR